MKKFLAGLILIVVFLTSFPGAVLAEDEVVICPQPYGGGVVCGVKTHEPVETGLAENLALIGAGLLASSAILVIISKRFQKISA